MKRLLVFIFFGHTLVAAALAAEPSAEARAAKAKAYELFEQKEFERSAEQFQKYFAEARDDFGAAIDYAGLLSQLNRHTEAARVLESVHQKQPQNEPAYFKLGVAYLTLKRLDDAERVFAALEQSTNRDMAATARDALSRLRDERAREARHKEEEYVYKLAGDFKHDEVIREVEKLESTGELS